MSTQKNNLAWRKNLCTQRTSFFAPLVWAYTIFGVPYSNSYIFFPKIKKQRRWHRTSYTCTSISTHMMFSAYPSFFSMTNCSFLRILSLTCQIGSLTIINEGCGMPKRFCSIHWHTFLFQKIWETNLFS